MQRPSGNAAVRLSIWTLLIASFAMALVQPVQAGTQAAPEIADPANDQAAAGEVPIAQQPPAGTTVGLSIDLLFGWVEEPAATPDSLLFTVQIQGTGGASTSSSQEWRFHFTISGTEYVASAAVDMANAQGGLPGSGATTPGGVTSEVTNAGDGLIIMKVPKANIGNPAPGTVLTGLFVEAESFLFGELPGWITDRAPDADFGTDYTMAGGSGNATDPNDTDGDGLNDTWEQQYFGNTTAENATGDPDGDGLTNGQEEALGTDPTEADTDGDGVGDQDDPAPTDPSVGGNTTTTTSSSTSSSSSSSTSSTTSSSSTTTGAAGGGTSDGDVENLDDAIERLEADPAYLGMSAGGLLAVLVLSIIALAVRWSL